MSENDPHAHGPLLSADAVERATALAAIFAASTPTLSSPVASPEALDFLARAADGVLRPEGTTAPAAALHRLAGDVPAALPWRVRGAVQLGGAIAPVLPSPAVPFARRALSDALSPLSLDARTDRLGPALAGLGADAVADLRLTAPTVRGESAARHRLDGIRALAARDDVARVSVAVREVVTGLSRWAFEADVEHAAERLLPLFRDAAGAGTRVTLVAEGRDDLDLTVAVLTRVLEESSLSAADAGIALPIAVPEALGALRELAAWARVRVAAGGAPLAVRLDDAIPATDDALRAARHGWRAPAVTATADLDALAVAAVREALGRRAAEGLRVAFATGDPVRAAIVRVLADTADVPIDLALPLGVAWSVEGAHIVLAPVVHPDDADAVVAPLAAQAAERRASDDDVHARVTTALATPELSPAPPREPQRGTVPTPPILREPAADDSPEPGLTQAVLGIARDAAPGDTQALGPDVQQMLFGGQAFVDTAVFSVRETAELSGAAPGFRNTSAADPTVAADRAWAHDVLAAVSRSTAGDATAAAGRIDDEAGLDAVVSRVREAAEEWGSRAATERAAVIEAASRALAERRAELVEVLASEGGALFTEADAEVDEAVDAAAYYALTVKELDRVAGAVFVPDRLTVVAPRWNSSVGLCAAETLAALAAGSGVILTPSPRARRAGAVVAEALWAAGVPRDAFAYVDLNEEASGRALLVHPGVDRVLLAGARATAERFLEWRPSLPLQALTAGRNAVVVAPSADLDRAVADIVAGAFARAGQAATASSLVILVGAAARSTRFLEQLKDAVASLRVGPADDPLSDVGPLVEEPQGDVRRALTVLADGERWLVEPRELDLGPETAGRFWTPGVRTGVHAGSHLTRTAVAAPVLGILHAPTLGRAIELQNVVGSGFVAGLHTRDAADLDLWLDTVDAAVLRVNRPTTGGVVQREPLGGRGVSGVGPGAMSGGPNRLVALGSWRPSSGGPASSTLHLRGLDTRISSLIEAAQPTLDYAAFEWLRRGALSDAVAWDRDFARVKDASRLGLERNLLRYRPTDVAIRATADAPWQAVLRVLVAAVRSGSDFSLSTPVGLPAAVRHLLGESAVPVSVETDEEWLQRMAGGIPDAEPAGDAVISPPPRPSRVRLVGTADTAETLRVALVEALGGDPSLTMYSGEVTTAGRIELLPFLREQAISIEAFRFGRPDPWSAEVI
ncbi:proline dehydrogenase family protein [Microbacterium sp. IEGM 1404]|uniref:proline dehydrogenase family protein n=1 Tax=Microbacterium sp. IEGM 1404 TaxID=3047084 RepID=UPI0024B69EE0|nr:proline dehydrogenase family protein [Microbacterium sp. IEGM 1404]MDI9891293.1 proline dehydrogenase family protein [Microbacterium sp. IEGM 1404]